jgi:hypothetical protein
VLKNYLYIITVLLIFASCKKKSVPADSVDVGKDYYPLTLGKYVTYEVDSTVYDEFTFLPKTSKYRIKEKIEEEFTDTDGKPALRLMRYIKKYDSTKTYDQIAWTVKDAWQVNQSNTSLQVVEENVRFTKLIFAVKENAQWDGNANNTIGEWDYTYSYMDKTETINGVDLEKVCFIKQKDYRTLISYQYYIEKYARGVGLVYREIKDLKLGKDGTVILGGQIENNPKCIGTIYKLTILSYGNE